MRPEQRLYPDEEWFGITLADAPFTVANQGAFVAAFAREFENNNDYVRNVCVSWDGDGKGLLVYIEDLGYVEAATAEIAAHAVVQDLTESPESPDGYQVSIIASRQIS